jgi:hypothetical protein
MAAHFVRTTPPLDAQYADAREGDEPGHRGVVDDRAAAVLEASRDAYFIPRKTPVS